MLSLLESNATPPSHPLAIKSRLLMLEKKYLDSAWKKPRARFRLSWLNPTWPMCALHSPYYGIWLIARSTMAFIRSMGDILVYSHGLRTFSAQSDSGARSRVRSDSPGWIQLLFGLIYAIYGALDVDWVARKCSGVKQELDKVQESFPIWFEPNSCRTTLR